MDKEILGIDDYEKIALIETAEEADKYLYDAKVVKKISEDAYKNGAEDIISLFKAVRKKNMEYNELKGENIMESTKTVQKKQIDWNKANAIVGVTGGLVTIGLSLYQLITMIRQNREAKKALAEMEKNASDEDKKN